METSRPWQFTFRGLLITSAALAVVGVVGGWLVRGTDWAWAFVSALAWLIAAWMALGVLQLLVVAWSRLRPVRVEASRDDPFAGDELPPQWVVPDEPE